jgi:hypothetical protein
VDETQALEDARELRDERGQVHDWRLAELLRAGYPFESAEQIAHRLDIDLHAAIGLVTRGCAPQLAATILL